MVVIMMARDNKNFCGVFLVVVGGWGEEEYQVLSFSDDSQEISSHIQ